MMRHSTTSKRSKKTIGYAGMIAETTTQIIEYQEDSVKITVPSGEGLEYKLHMLKGDTIRHAWSSAQGELFFTFMANQKVIRALILKVTPSVQPTIYVGHSQHHSMAHMVGIGRIKVNHRLL